MSIEEYLVFVGITVVFLLSPGPSVLLAINNGAKYGVKLGLIGALGNILAFQVLIILSVLGLGAALVASGELFYILKILGAIYLISLGVKIWFASIPKLLNEKSPSEEIATSLCLFKQAFFVTSSNPKALVYVAALLPQFINTQQSLLIQIVILALTSGVIQFVIFLSYVLLASRVKKLLRNPLYRKIFNRFSGGTFIVFGVVLGLTEKEI